MKPKFKSAFMDVARRFAELSTARKLHVGAIVVKDGRIVSIGYNGMPSGWENECEDKRYEEGEYEPHVWYESKKEVLHAEANAITKLARSNESSEGAVMFCTHTPCIECAKLIHQSGIKHVYFGEDYVASKGAGVEFLEQCGIVLERVI